MSGKIINWFRKKFSKRPAYKELPVGFPELDLDRVIQDLRLKTLGEKKGANEKPETESVQLDDVETRIVDFIEGERKYAIEQFCGNLTTYADRLQNLVFHSRISAIDGKADVAVTDLKKSVHQGVNHLLSLKEGIGAVGDEIAKFKTDNKLSRTASYPESLILRYGILLMILVVEASLNGVFLATGHELGLMGGFGEAIVIAALNVGVGWAVGRFILPEVFHVSKIRKISGVFLVLFYIAIAIVFNIAVAHYRDALTGMNPEQAGLEALRSFWSQPFGINDIKSWLLTVMGFSFSIIACVDTFGMDDRYPGYGRLVRRYAELREDYIEEKEELLSALNEIKENVLEDIDELANEIERSRHLLKTITGGKTNMIARFREHLEYLEASANRLMSVYRESNQSSRTTPVPDRFNREWKSAKTVNIAALTKDYSTDVQIRPEDVDDAFNLLKQSRKKVLSEYQRSFKEYKRLEDL